MDPRPTPVDVLKSALRAVIVLLALLSVAIPRSASGDPRAGHYVCSPCGMACDGKVYDRPGTCPVCGAALVSPEAARTASEGGGRRVAIVVFDGVEIIDFTGPWEVFGGAGFEVVTVARTREPVTTAMGLRVVPRYTFADAPAASVVVVPGGSVTVAQSSPALLTWVKDATARAEHTMSVCNGAFILAHAGLLDGLTATTTAHFIDALASEFPRTRVVRDRRYVDNGKIITAAGLSAGIDGALHLVGVMSGVGAAQAEALRLEYDWRLDGTFARAALADQLIPHLGLDDLGRWSFERTEGSTEQWEMVLRVSTSAPGAQVEDSVGRHLAEGGWTRTSAVQRGAISVWRFADGRGRPWIGAMGVEAMAGGEGQYRVRCRVARADATTASRP